MELIHSFTAAWRTVVCFMKFVLESISAFVCCLRLITSLIQAVGLVQQFRNFMQDIPALRVQFGSWLALALEFQLGADIVSTTVNPTWQSLGELGAAGHDSNLPQLFSPERNAGRGADWSKPQRPKSRWLMLDAVLLPLAPLLLTGSAIFL